MQKDVDHVIPNRTKPNQIISYLFIGSKWENGFIVSLKKLKTSINYFKLMSNQSYFSRLKSIIFICCFSL